MKFIRNAVFKTDLKVMTDISECIKWTTHVNVAEGFLRI